MGKFLKSLSNTDLVKIKPAGITRFHKKNNDQNHIRNTGSAHGCKMADRNQFQTQRLEAGGIETEPRQMGRYRGSSHIGLGFSADAGSGIRL